jgi:hypothetical protein
MPAAWASKASYRSGSMRLLSEALRQEIDEDLS